MLEVHVNCKGVKIGQLHALIGLRGVTLKGVCIYMLPKFAM